MFRRGERGQATVELVLALPIAALLLAGLFEVGMLAIDQARLVHAAREAARVAVVDPDPAAARAAVEEAGIEDADVSVRPAPAYRVQGQTLTVTLSFRPTATVPVVGELFKSAVLMADATMRIEEP